MIFSVKLDHNRHGYKTIKNSFVCLKHFINTYEFIMHVWNVEKTIKNRHMYLQSRYRLRSRLFYLQRLLCVVPWCQVPFFSDNHFPEFKNLSLVIFITLLRFNSHTIQFSHESGKKLIFLVYSWSCENLTTINFRTFYSPPCPNPKSHTDH